jgi:hypothetical protein
MKKACSFFLFFALSGSIGVGAPLERIGDLGAADMNITNPKFRVKVYEGKCGGPLSDALKRCRISFVGDRLSISTNLEISKEDLSQFDEVPGILADQVRHISWKDNGSVATEKGYGFVNEIIYESRSGNLVRAAFTFTHGDQVRGFYPALLQWMSARDAVTSVIE